MMRICVFHSDLNVKNSIIFLIVRIMYAKHFPDTQLCPVSKRICFVYIFNGSADCFRFSINSRQKKKKNVFSWRMGQ